MEMNDGKDGLATDKRKQLSDGGSEELTRVEQWRRKTGKDGFATGKRELLICAYHIDYHIELSQ